MEHNDIVAVILSFIGAVGGAGAWGYYQKRLELNSKEEDRKIKESNVYRDDLRERVAILEAKLEESLEERGKLMERLTQLTSETTALRVEVQYLREERDRLLTRLEEFLREN